MSQRSGPWIQAPNNYGADNRVRNKAPAPPRPRAISYHRRNYTRTQRLLPAAFYFVDRQRYRWQYRAPSPRGCTNDSLCPETWVTRRTATLHANTTALPAARSCLAWTNISIILRTLGSGTSRIAIGVEKTAACIALIASYLWARRPGWRRRPSCACRFR